MPVDLRHSIYRRGGRAGWTLEYREAGKVVQRSFDRRTDAEQAWDDLKDERRRMAGLSTAIPAFRDYARRWLDGLRPHLRPSSLLKYEWALVHLDALAARQLDTIDRETVRTLLGTKAATLSHSSAASIGSVLHVCLAEAVADGYIRSNPAVGGGSLRRRREGPRAVKAMDTPQLRAFLAAADGWRDFFHVMWALGLRPGEAMALQPADVDFARSRVRVERTVLVAGGVGPTKAGSGGWVDLAPGAADVLRRHSSTLTPAATSAGVAWLWPGRDGPMGHATVEHAFKRIAARAGLPGHLTPHCLRHTFAAMLLQAGRSIYYVQRMLRHASIQITVDTYGSWLDPGRPEHVAAMEAEVLVSGGSVAAPTVAVAGEKPCLLTP
jgi:integrase